jgi:hypothetical protein
MIDLNALKEKQAAELAEAEAKNNLLAYIQQAGAPEPRFIHAYEFRGRAGTIQYSDRHSMASELPTLEFITDLAARLPAAPVTYTEARYRYFTPAAITKSLEGRGKFDGEIKSQYEVFPCWAEMDGFGSELNWFTEINGQYWEVCVNFRTPNQIGKTRQIGHVKRWGNHGPISSITGRAISYHQPDIYTLGDVWAGQYEGYLLGSGSPDSWGKARIYAHLCSDVMPTVADFARCLGIE